MRGATLMAMRRCHPAATLLATGVLVLACVSCDAHTTAPRAAIATITIDDGNQQVGTVGIALPERLVVLVRDATNQPVANVPIDWEVGAASGSVDQSTSSTDISGRASVTWTLGTMAGVSAVNAHVAGLEPAVFVAIAAPGPPARIVSVPETFTFGLGDSLTVHASVQDQFGNPLDTPAILYGTANPRIATITVSGTITATGIGDTRILASAAKVASSIPVRVRATGASPCGDSPASTANVGMTVSLAASATSQRVCLQSLQADAEYVLVAVSSDPVYSSSVAFDVVGLGITPPLSTVSNGTSIARQQARPDGSTDGRLLQLNQHVELIRREQERRDLVPLVHSARAAHAAARTARTLVAASQARTVHVGDHVRLNAESDFTCSNADYREGRVVVVGAHSIVVADTANPAGGYTTADYESLSAVFDTLVYPVDTATFGTPTDISGYGKVILFLTAAVNALTPRGAPLTSGGFFFARDLYPKSAGNGFAACPGSNEAEMFYLLVPDPNGLVNGNRRDASDVTRLNLGTLAHELEHLISAGRRLYVTPGAIPNEEIWLDEGLAHIAEEATYFRSAGVTSRENLGGAALTAPQSAAFATFGLQNFVRLASWLRAPESNSLYASNDSPATRGSTWQFLRYAAGRQPGTEAAFFRAIVNSATTGFTNLRRAIPNGQLTEYLVDRAVAAFTDDYPGVPPGTLDGRFAIPAWNFRSVYSAFSIASIAAGTYPLTTHALTHNSPLRVRLAGGGSTYLHFAVPASGTALISISVNGQAPPSSICLVVLRVR